MIKLAKPLTLAWLSTVTVLALGVWGWSIAPEQASRWAFIVFLLPALWGFVEFFQGGTRRERIMSFHRCVVAGTGLLLAVKVVPELAIASSFLDADWAPIARQLWGVTFGSLFAIWGNYVPKILSPWSVEEEWFDWQRVHRFVGWLATLSGLAIAAVWLFFSPEFAGPATAVLSVTFGVLAVGRKFISVAEYSRRRPTPPARQAGRPSDVPSVPL